MCLAIPACVEQLIAEEKMEMAVNTLDKCIEAMPNHNVPFDRLMVPIIQNYYRIGEDDKANEILDVVFNRYAEEFEYYLSTDTETSISLQQDIQMSFAVVQRLNMFVNNLYPQDDEIKAKIGDRFEMLDKAFDAKIQEIETHRTQPRVKF